MPPKGKGEALTARQIGLLRAWIDRGREVARRREAREHRRRRRDGGDEDDRRLAAAASRAAGRLREGHPAAPQGRVLRMPRPEEAGSRAALRPQGHGAGRRRRHGPRHRSRQERRERADSPRGHARRNRHAARRPAPHHRADRDAPRVDRSGRGVAGRRIRRPHRPQESLGLQGARPPAAARREEHRLGEDADRCLRARAPREGGPRSRARGRQGHAPSPRLAGPHGPAADVAGARRVPRRQGA